MASIAMPRWSRSISSALKKDLRGPRRSRILAPPSLSHALI